MKKIIKSTLGTIIVFSLAITGLFTTNMNQSSEFNISLANIEALAAGTESDVDKCDIRIYNRNESEATSISTVQASMGGGFYIIVNGKRVDLGIGAHAGGSVKYYYCHSSLGNCCKKSWMEKPVNYL